MFYPRRVEEAGNRFLKELGLGPYADLVNLGFAPAEWQREVIELVYAAFWLYSQGRRGVEHTRYYDVRKWAWPYSELRQADKREPFTLHAPWSVLLRRAYEQTLECRLLEAAGQESSISSNRH